MRVEFLQEQSKIGKQKFLNIKLVHNQEIIYGISNINKLLHFTIYFTLVIL